MFNVLNALHLDELQQVLLCGTAHEPTLGCLDEQCQSFQQPVLAQKQACQVVCHGNLEV